jgi:hypothetical protein
MRYTDIGRREIHNTSISNCVIKDCTLTINIGNINMRFGDINISIGDTSSRKVDKRRECVSGYDYTREEIEARMKFFKANSP